MDNAVALSIRYVPARRGRPPPNGGVPATRRGGPDLHLWLRGKSIPRRAAGRRKTVGRGSPLVRSFATPWIAFAFVSLLPVSAPLPSHDKRTPNVPAATTGSGDARTDRPPA